MAFLLARGDQVERSQLNLHRNYEIHLKRCGKKSRRLLARFSDLEERTRRARDHEKTKVAPCPLREGRLFVGQYSPGELAGRSMFPGTVGKL